MKNIINMLFISVTIVFNFSSCEDEVYPKGELTEKYVLNCLLNGNSDYQVAYLTKTYDVPGYDPYENEINPAVTDAQITLTQEEITYYFRDTSIAATPDSRYEGAQHFYYLDNFQPNPDKHVTIEARMKDGSVIRSEITTYKYQLISTSFYESNLRLPTGNTTGNILFKWPDYASDSYYLPYFLIIYSRIINNEEIFFEKEVAQIILNDKVQFPKLSHGNRLVYSVEAFEFSLESIAEEGIPREEYKIYGAKFILLTPNNSLATYYSAAKTFSDSYSIQLTEPEYTNIEGGLGVFGAYISYDIPVRIKENYIKSFGFTPGN